MAKLDKIPAKQLGALEALSTMKEVDFQALVAAIKETPATLDPSIFFKNVASRASQVLSTESIIETICGLYHFKHARKSTIEDIMCGIEESIKAEKKEAFEPLLSNLKPLKERLDCLLGLELSIGVTARALDVMMEQPHVFGHARILSDIRSVFTASADSIAAGFIVHNLTIHYFHDGDHKEFFVALDNDDLTTLKESIERAEQKTAHLKAMLAKASIPYLDAE